MQIPHRPHCGIAYAEPGLYEIPEFEQTHPELVTSGVDALHKTRTDQVIEDTMRGGGMKPCRKAQGF